MTLDQPLRAAAERLIARLGKPATLRRVTRSYDPATGKTAETARDYPVTVSPPEAFGAALIDGTLVEAGDRKTLLAAKAAPVVPEAPGDLLLIDGAAWTLLRVEPVMSGREAALYGLHLRR